MYIRSIITGTVCEIAVAVGSSIHIGDALLVIESMKMEIPVTSPIEGVVHEIAVEIGGLVNEGDVLAEVV